MRKQSKPSNTYRHSGTRSRGRSRSNGALIALTATLVVAIAAIVVFVFIKPGSKENAAVVDSVAQPIGQPIGQTISQSASQPAAESSATDAVGDAVSNTAGAAAGDTSAATVVETGSSIAVPTDGKLLSEPTTEFTPYHIHLMMVGDNLYHGGLVREGIQADGSRNYDFEFEGIMQSLLSAADIKIINQESPLGGDDREFTSYPVFNTPTEVGDATAKAGFNVIIAATNHARDAGQSGTIHMSNFYADEYPELLVCGIHGTSAQTQTIEIQTPYIDSNTDYQTWQNAIALGVEEDLAAALLPYNHSAYACGTIDWEIEMGIYDSMRTQAQAQVAALGGDASGTATVKEVSGAYIPDSASGATMNASSGVLPTAVSRYTKDTNSTAVSTQYGDSNPTRIKVAEVDGYKFAILNYTYSINWESWPSDVEDYIERLNPYDSNRTLQFDVLYDQVLADIALADQIADIVIVCPHWGIEYTFTPIERQVRFANQMIDAGADLILGAHPHVIEPVEYITTDAGNTGLCFYSVGNYISTQDHPERVLEMVAWVSFLVDENGVSIDESETGGLPIINHFTLNNGFHHRIYALDEYSEELANQHGMRYHGDGGIVRYSDMESWANQVIGDKRLYLKDILGESSSEETVAEAVIQ